MIRHRNAMCSNHRLRPLDEIGRHWLYSDPYSSNSVLDYSGSAPDLPFPKMALT